MNEFDEAAPDDLDGPLRDAVEQVRNQPVPHEAVARTLARASGIGGTTMDDRSVRSPALVGLLALASAAAILLVLWPRPTPETRVASLPTPVPMTGEFGQSEPQATPKGFFGGRGPMGDSRSVHALDPAKMGRPGSGPANVDRLEPENRSSMPGQGQGLSGREQSLKGQPGSRPDLPRDALVPTDGTGQPGPDGGRRISELSGDGVSRHVSPPGTPALLPAAPASSAPHPEPMAERPTSGATENTLRMYERGGQLNPSRLGGPSTPSKSDPLRNEGEKSERGIEPTVQPAKPGQPDTTKILRAKEDDKVGGKPAEGKKPDPVVWHRDRRRPTFARVYVGDGNALELVSLQVTVRVEGPRARTFVDHVFRNPHDRQLEGTFEYPLPTGASASYFAMFSGAAREAAPPRFGGRDVPPLPGDGLMRLAPEQVARHVSTADWGRLQEARVVNKEKALETYEEIVRGRIDPALLEYAGGNTFTGRVFPIAPRGYQRVLLAYEELLPYTAAGVQYRFPLPECKLAELGLTLEASEADATQRTFQPADAKHEAGGGRVRYQRSWTGQAPGGDALFTFTPPRPEIQIVSGRRGENGPTYAYARVRPKFPDRAAAPFAKRAVFLLDTSLSEHPERFAVNVELLKRILEGDADLEQFNVLTFDVAARWLEPSGWLANTPAGRQQALAKLEGTVLEGATDVGAALDACCATPFVRDGKAPVNLFLLTDGQVTWGEGDAATLAARFEHRCSVPARVHAYRLGLGAENQELFEALTRTGGGIFTCHGEADLAATAAAHRRQALRLDGIRVVGGPTTSDVLLAGRRLSVAPGGEVVVALRATGPGQATLVLEGTFQGEKYAQEYPLEIGRSSELAARGWGELAVASLLALNDPKMEPLVTAYCQEFGIASRSASFLILENENDYKRLNLEEERGKTLTNQDLGAFLEAAWRSLTGPVGPKEALSRFLGRVAGRSRLWESRDAAHVRKLVDLLTDAECDLPEAPLTAGLPRRGDVPPAYLAAVEANRREVQSYLAESRRRGDQKDIGGAIRALSSVVEEYPGRADALRLVGYRLLDLGQSPHAVRLFDRVQRSRPFEPHSYRDLARSLEEAGCYGLAAVQYEVLLAGTWHNRFHAALKEVAREEYARMMQEAVRSKKVRPELANLFGARLEGLGTNQGSGDLRVTMSWNTDTTDIDLWVIEPDGTKCFYQHVGTKNGGRLSTDQTQGYGPERYLAQTALKGTYAILVHYYRPNPNLLGGETHVQVVVTRFAGTPREVSERHTVILKRHDEQAEVCRVGF